MTEEERRLSELPNWENHFELQYIKGRYSPCHILDFGCGYGFSDIHLARTGFTVTGYDSDLERIKCAMYMAFYESDEVRGRLSFHINEFPEGEYDLVWMSHVMEHIPLSDWPKVFSLVAGAPILISVPLGAAYDNPGHINHWYTEEELFRDLTETTVLPWRVWIDHENLVIKAESI